MKDLRISELSSRSGVPVTTLRFYDGAGLLPADRTPAGYRVYGQAAVERLEFITAVKRLGLPREEIAALLRVREDGSCDQVRGELRSRLAARLAGARAQAADLAAFSSALHQAVAHLDAAPEREERCGAECGCTSAGEACAPDLVCTLDSRELPERMKRWQALLAGADREAIPDGVRFTLPAALAARAAGLAAAELECCAFFDFQLGLRGGELRLEVRGPAGAVAQFGELLSAPAQLGGEPAGHFASKYATNSA